MRSSVQLHKSLSFLISFSYDAYNCTIVHRLHPPITSKHEDSAAIMEMGSTMRSSPKILIYKLKIYFLDLWLGYMLCQRKCIFWGFYWIPSMECSNTWMTFSFPQFPISILIINKSYAYLSHFNPINLINKQIWSFWFFYKHTEYSDYHHKESPFIKGA